MNNSNKKKNDLLGIPFGTASNRLKKIILFTLLIKLHENICFQCGQEIETVDELSIEHKEPWMDAENPIESFYNLNNITFSHLKCNCLAAKRATGIRESTPHGRTRYLNGCRCKECVEFMQKFNTSDRRRKYNREYQRKRYNSDEEFRNNNIKKSLNYHNKQKDNTPII